MHEHGDGEALGVRARWLIPIALATLWAMVGSLALTSAPALAVKIYYPDLSFGGGPCVVKPGEPCAGKFDEPEGVAFNDATGDVYVVDKGNRRVEEFDEKGVFVREFAPPGGFTDPEQVAIDNSCQEQKPEFSGAECTKFDESNGDVYVTDAGQKVVDKFTSTGGYEGQLTMTEGCEKKEEPWPCSESKRVAMPLGEVHSVAVGPSGDVWLDETESHQVEELKEIITVYEARVDEFSDTSVLIDRFRTGGVDLRADRGYEDRAFAVDSIEDLYVATGVGRTIAKYEPSETTGYKEAHYEASEGVNALAAIPSTSSELTNDVLADVGGEIVTNEGNVLASVPFGIERYGEFGEPEGNPLELFPGEAVPVGFVFSESYGLAVNNSATVYASERATDKVQRFAYVRVPEVGTEAASNVTETGLTLHGIVNPEGEEVTKCDFEYGTEVGRYTGEVECEPPVGDGVGHIGQGDVPVAVSAVVSGLKLSEVRSFRLVAVGPSGAPAYGRGLTVSRPEITDEANSEVGPTVATAQAEIDPGGIATCYWLEYGTETSYGGRYPQEGCVPIGEGEESEPVSVEVTGLKADTGYHFRFAASNGLGLAAGADVAFTTFSLQPDELPDGRVYEAVSAVGAGHGTNVYVPAGMEQVLKPVGRHGIGTKYPFEVSADGESVAYVGDPPASGGNGQIGVGLGNSYVARRALGGGWAQVAVNPATYANSYVAFSGDLQTGILESGEQLGGAPTEGGEAYPDLYRRSIEWSSNGGGSPQATLGAPEALVTSSPEGCTPLEFGAALENQLYAEGPFFGGGNVGTAAVPAFSHLLFEANAALPATPAVTTPAGCRLKNDLYDWFDGRLYLIDVLPTGTGETAPNATFGRQGGSIDGSVTPERSGAISADGSRIFWSAVETVEAEPGRYEERPAGLYVRENDTLPEGCAVVGDACTVRLDVVQEGASQVGVCAAKPAECEHPAFWTASADGSRVFFTDEERLTVGATAEAGSPDLYEYNLEAPEGERLTDLSIPIHVGKHGEAQGVMDASEDGSWVYFVADGVLTEGENAEESEPVEGQPNLYVRHEGVTTFIATLAKGDNAYPSGTTEAYDGDWQADPGKRTAEATPDGRDLVFMSRRPLTGYANGVEGEVDGEKTIVPLTEVFLYDAESAHLVCVSCNPSGEAPMAPARSEFAKNITEAWGSFLPVSESLASYQPRLISTDGRRVFFNSIEPLVPQDTNGFLGVYEWEAQGEGSCREARDCVSLLSRGTSTDNSYMIDASSNGDDVFFVSRAQLVKADRGGQTDVLYDARVDGYVAPETARCSGTGCQGVAPPPPIFATPASVTFTGTGNFPVLATTTNKVTKKKTTRGCHKDRVRRHGRCVRRKRPRKANKTARADDRPRSRR